MTIKRTIQKTHITEYFSNEIPQLKLLKTTKRLQALTNLDMIHMNLYEISYDFLNELDSIGIFTKNGYSKGDRYRIYYGTEEIYFSIMNYSFGKRFTTQLQVNPKDFKSSTMFFELLELILGEELSINNHKITRIDPSFSISENYVSTSLIAISSNFKWKRKTTKFFMQAKDFASGEETGYRTNSRGSNYSTYNQIAKRIVKKDKITHSELPMTRFEFQLRTYDLKVQKIFTVFDMYKLKRKKTFSKMDFFDPTVGNIKSKIDREKFIELQIKIIRLGFHQARMHLNRNPKDCFRAKYSHLLVPLTINNGKAKLKTCLRNRFSEWFNEWWINDYISIYADGRVPEFNREQVELLNSMSPLKKNQSPKLLSSSY